MTEAENPRAVAGNNEAPDAAKEVTDRLAREYASISATVTELLDEARAAPKVINDEEQHEQAAKLIVRMRDVKKRLEALHDSEKQPYLRGGIGVDQFFFGLWDKLLRRKNTNKPGAVDILQDRVTNYLERKLAEERRLRAEAERVAREAREKAEAEAREKARLAQEAIEAAARARSEAKKEEHRAEAAAQSAAAQSAAAAAAVAAQKAEDARVEQLVKPADIVRTRFEDGGMSTMGTEPYADIIDEEKLSSTPGNIEKLWRFIPLEQKAKALRAWAKNTGHTQQMEGASIGKRNKAVTR